MKTVLIICRNFIYWSPNAVKNNIKVMVLTSFKENVQLARVVDLKCRYIPEDVAC